MRDDSTADAGHDLEVQPELLPQLVLPLLDQAARGDDQAPGDVAAEHQLADQQARHDRLAGAGIVGEEEPQRLLLEEPVVDRVDLVGVRLDVRGVDRCERIREVRPLHPTGL